MRGLKCKVLMLCEKMFESKEAPKAFYREKRLHKYYKELKKLKKKKLKNRMEDVKKGKHKFYVSSKRQLRRDYTHRKFLIEPKKSKAKSARNQLRNFKSKLGREESYPFLSLTNQDLLRFPNKVKLISEKLKTWEVDLVRLLALIIRSAMTPFSSFLSTERSFMRNWSTKKSGRMR